MLDSKTTEKGAGIIRRHDKNAIETKACKKTGIAPAIRQVKPATIAGKSSPQRYCDGTDSSTTQHWTGRHAHDQTVKAPAMPSAVGPIAPQLEQATANR